MRNPKWHRDEIILALDLYFSSDRGSIDDKNSKIIQVSKILNDRPQPRFVSSRTAFRPHQSANNIQPLQG